MMGLEAAIYGPFCTGILGGSAYNVLGPAGALVNVLNTMTAVYQEKIIPFLAIGCACIGILSFYFTGHRYFDEVDNQVAVLEGFSLSISIVIGLG